MILLRPQHSKIQRGTGPCLFLCQRVSSVSYRRKQPFKILNQTFREGQETADQISLDWNPKKAVNSRAPPVSYKAIRLQRCGELK